jgi:hypothetical protein
MDTNLIFQDILFLDINGVYKHSSYINEILPNITYCQCWFNEYPLNINLDNYRKKIVFVPCSFLDGPDYDFSNFDLVVVIDYELINPSIPDYLKSLETKFSNKNIIIIVSAVRQDQSSDARVYLRPNFLLRLPQINSYEETNNIVKPKMFDALLGLNRPHRQFIFDSLRRYNLLDSCLVSILSNNSPTADKNSLYYSQELFDLETPLAQDLIKNVGSFDSYQTIYSVPLHTINYFVSQQIPWNIYRNSYYSIVAETNGENYCFFSEKTAKPLYAKRLFVMFGSQGQLQQLKNWGFKTFDNIIDESYDLVSDNFERYRMAFEQVIKLCSMDPIRVHTQIQDIVEHNHKLICNLEYFNRPLRSWLINKII